MSRISVKYDLMMVPPNIIFKARVNQATFEDTAAQVTFDTVTVGAYTDIKSEMLILFGTTEGADDLGRARVRKQATSSVLYFGWASRSKAGEGEAYLQDNAYITITDQYKPWTKNPRIDDNGVTYTDYDRDYPSWGANPPIVILNCGPAVQRPLTEVSNTKALFTFDASDSYVTDTGSSIESWTWQLPAGSTFVTGSITTPAISFTLPEGAGWAYLTIQDTQNTVSTRRVLCIAGEPTGVIDSFDNVRISRKVDGQELKLRVNQDVLTSNYPNGCMAVLWRTVTINSVVQVPTLYEHIAFVGWHHSDDFDGRAELSGYIENTRLTFKDTAGWLAVLPGYPIIINRKTLATTWEEMPFADIDLYYVRLLSEYSNILSLTDFTWSGIGYAKYYFSSLASKGQSLYEQVDGRAQAIAHKFTCDRYGRLFINPDPMLLDPAGVKTGAARTTTVQKAITESDWSRVNWSYRHFPRVNWNWGNAVVSYNLDVDDVQTIPTVFAVAPGKAPSQGSAPKTSGEQLVMGQNEINAREGYRYAARMNNKYQTLEVALTGYDDFSIEPAAMTWVTFTGTAPKMGRRGYSFTAHRCLPFEVIIIHNSDSGVQNVILRLEPETTGDDASTYVPPTGDPPDVPDDPTDDQPPDDLGTRIYLLHKNGKVSLTSDFAVPSESGGPSYDISDLSLDGIVLGAAGDPFSPKYLGTGTTANLWVVTSTRIYYIADVGDVVSRTVTSVHTFAASSLYRAIQTERGFEQWVIVTSYYPGVGTKSCRSKFAKSAATFSEVTISTGTMSSGGYEAPAGITFEFTGEITNFSGKGSLSVERILDGFGLRITTTWPKGIFQSNSCRFMINNTGTGITSMKVETHEVSGLGIPFNDWHAVTCPGVGTWGPMTTQEPGTDEEFWDTANLLSDGYEFVYTGLSGGNFVHFGGSTNTLRACPQSFNGGTYVFDMIVTELNGTPTFNASQINPQPTIHVSGKIPGLAYAGAVLTGNGKLYRSRDYGFSWTAVASPSNDFDDELGGAFMFPWDDNPEETIYYWGKLTSGVWSTYRNASNITPEAGYGPAGPRCFTAFRSEAYGDSWDQIISPAAIEDSYIGIHIADNSDIMYFWGSLGVGYSSNKGQDIDPRNGDSEASEVLLVGGW
jgi:hypothetical protein